MKKDFDAIVDLFRKSWAGIITLPEKNELNKLLEDEKLQEIYRTLNSDGLVRQRLEEYSRFSHRDAFRKFRQQTRNVDRYKRIVYYSVVGAAAVVLLFIGNMIWVRQIAVKTEVTQLVQNTSGVIEPGSKKATLRLASGERINIATDSLKIKEKDGTEIDYNNGAISYNSKEDTRELVYNELIVPAGGECCLVLEDGTRVWINSDTKLKYPVKFIGKERRVFLDGEAYFEVVKDGKPFIVNTLLGEVKVLGTSFDVQAYRNEDKTYTTLVSGRVAFTGTAMMEIGPGEQVVASKSGEMEKRRVDVVEYTGWKDGIYQFNRQKLETIMNTLARWYNVSVFYQNPGLKNIEFTGNLKRYENINIFMDILQRTGDVKYKINKNTLILYQ